jgi:hypothetical protein
MLVSSWRGATLGVMFLWCLGCQGLLVPAPRVSAPPPPLPSLPGTRLVPQPFATVWTALVTQDSQPAFVLQTQEPAARLLTFTYTGVPDRYVTCGELGPSGRDSAPSRPPRIQRQALIGKPHSVQLHRRIHLLVTAESATQTRLMTTVWYTLTPTKTLQIAREGGDLLPAEPIRFTSGQVGQELRGEVPPLICQPTGVLEQEVFALVP